MGDARSLIEMILMGAAQDLVNKGQITEVVAGWEILKSMSPRVEHDLFYWENTANGTTSEVDYLIAKDLQVVPVEIKSGVTGKMKSLRLFMRRKHLLVGKRCSLENFGIIEFTDAEDEQHPKETKRIYVHPLYCLESL
ncbi:MAG: DUF4143 domain-containing protein [Prevotella sp.]|nr:DUF4143 domain-containing protein [Prevotella sp.]